MSEEMTSVWILCESPPRKATSRFYKVDNFQKDLKKYLIFFLCWQNYGYFDHFCYKRIQNVCVSATPRKLPKRIGSMLASSRRVHARGSSACVTKCRTAICGILRRSLKSRNASSRRGPPAHHDGPFGKALSAAAPLLYVSTIYLPSYIP